MTQADLTLRGAESRDLLAVLPDGHGAALLVHLGLLGEPRLN